MQDILRKLPRKRGKRIWKTAHMSLEGNLRMKIMWWNFFSCVRPQEIGQMVEGLAERFSLCRKPGEK